MRNDRPEVKGKPLKIQAFSGGIPDWPGAGKLSQR
jgi:hypothetical protein